jgi:F-type H+-transporting ATPase subunit gamma
VFKNSEAVAPEGGRELFIVVSSDKGLCGGIHSSVTKKTKSTFAKMSPSAGDANNPEGPAIVVLGDKSKAQLSRALPKNVELSFNQVGKNVPTFAEAAAIADTIIKSGIKFDKVTIVYNRYATAISFEADLMEAFSENALRNSPSFGVYEQEEDTTKDLAEFSLANAIFAALAEGHASEINSRRNAMDSASKNAGDMITNLNMQYNRGRQAAITNELVDIITGASAQG